MNCTESFSADYCEAREKFRAHASAAGGKLESITHPERGPSEETLSTDVAYFGSPNASRIGVLISATHGVEGFCGSGAQIDLLRRGELAHLPPDVAVLMIHAINPYGFAWLRRVTHENVDLNRNWIDFAQPAPENRDYALLERAICPSNWTAESQALSLLVLEEFAATRGAKALQNALSAGQYAFPKGIYYGGTAPTWSRLTQTSIFQHYLSSAEVVGVLDYHTGLGPSGFAEPIMTELSNSDEYLSAQRWYGLGIRSIRDGTSSAGAITGDGMSAAPRLLPNAQVVVVAMEFGTVALAETDLVLRADAWLHAHGAPGTPQANQIQQAVKRAFYEDTSEWKGMIAGQSLAAFRKMLLGLAE